MKDEEFRAITRDGAGELDRVRLGAERARRGLCPWCGEVQDPERTEGCCCIHCFDRELREGRRKASLSCEGCPVPCTTCKGTRIDPTCTAADFFETKVAQFEWPCPDCTP